MLTSIPVGKTDQTPESQYMHKGTSHNDEHGGGATFKLVDAVTAAQIEECGRLFREYERRLGVDLCFQGFAQEVETLPGAYAPPEGALILAFTATGSEVCDETAKAETAGCVALRRLAPGICEMKRLFVRPRFRGTGMTVPFPANSHGVFSWRSGTTIERSWERMILYPDP